MSTSKTSAGIASVAATVVLLGACASGDEVRSSSSSSSVSPSDARAGTSAVPVTDAVPHSYVGMWVTGDGNIRQELRADGRYVEARGQRENAYQGDYQIVGSKVTYQDDTGFSADGHFENGILFHAGMVMYRDVEQGALR
ncbi:MAG: Atu4866 domain-containing protein [Rhodococcus sp. (in: high G+C Gram-positive bacteria)]